MSHLLRRLAGHFDFRQLISWDGMLIPVSMLLIVGANLAWVARDEYQQTQESEFRLLEAHARNTDAQVSRALGKVERLLNQLASHKLLMSARSDGKLSAITERYGDDVSGLGVLLEADAEGRIRSATDRALIGRNVAAEPWFSIHHNEGRTPHLFMSRPARGLLGVKTVVFSLPLMDADDRFLGVVGINIDYRFFQDILRTINPADSESMSVIYNRDGDMVYRRADTEKYFGFNMIKTSTVYFPHLQAGQPTTRHIGPSAVDGKTRLFVVWDVGDTGLSLILSRQRGEVLATWERNVVIYSLIYFFTMAVVILLALVALRRKRDLVRGKAFTDRLIATANVMVVGLDEHGRVSIFNHAAENVTGYRSEEMMGRDWFELAVPLEDPVRIGGVFRRFQENEGKEFPHALDYTVMTKTGHRHVISWQNSVLPEPRTVICFGIDVTERKEAEAERDRFVTMVSHEFRTPLATIDGAVQLLEMRADAVGDAVRKRYRTIRNATDRLTILLDDYLLQERLGRITHGLDLEAVSPLSLLCDMQVSALALSVEHKVIIEDGPYPEAVVCDADLIRLALRVLADNAVKYTPSGSEVRLACCAVDGGVEFLVQDNGSGIWGDELPHIFDKFFRGRSAAKLSGTGIGLHLARSVVESHGGTLTARNGAGGGAEFRVFLPGLIGTDVEVEVRIG